MSSLQVHVLEVKNIKAISHLHIKPSTITVISGKNASGKTSILDAIRNVFDGGHDPSMVRKGEKVGRIFLGLSDGTTIEKTITAKTSRLEVLQPDGRRVDGGDKTYLESLASALSVDPGRLLNLKTKEIAKAILDVLNIQFWPDEIEQIGISRPDGPINLESLDKLRAEIYEQRRRTNIALRDKRGTIADIEKVIPKTLPVDARATMDDTQRKLAAVEELVRQELVSIGETEKAEVSAIREAYAQKLRELEQWQAKALDEVQRRFAEARAKVESDAKPVREQLQSELVALREVLAQYERITALHQQVEKHRDEAAALDIRVDQLTKQIEQLDKLKSSRLDRLPVPGLSYRDGEFFVDGVPWAHANSARRTQIACDIAALRAGPLRMICLDDAEHLDQDSQSALEEWAHAHDFQIFAALVNDATLAVETQ